MERTNNILKNIEIQQKFADLIFKDFRSKRFGINTCCSIDQKNKYSIQKSLCDWDDKKKPTYTKEYKETNWVNCTKPIPEWVQYGDFAPAETNCPPCKTYPPPHQQPCYLTVWFYKNQIVDWPNESNNAKLIAQAQRPGSGEWITVGECLFPHFNETVAPNGDIQMETVDTTDGTFCDRVENPDDPKNWILKFRIYHDDFSEPGYNGAEKSNAIRFFIDDPVDGERKVYLFQIHDQDWETYNETDNPQLPNNWGDNIYPNGAGCISGNFATIKTRWPQIISLICDEDPCERCVFCGEGWPHITNPIDGTTPQVDINQAPVCECDSECILFTVTNACGKPVANWEIVLDGGLIGHTNDEGIFTHTIDKASINNKHSLDICGFCFTTTGNCNQKKIDITIDDGSECTCANPEHHCYIRKEDDCSFEPIYPNPPGWTMM